VSSAGEHNLKVVMVATRYYYNKILESQEDINLNQLSPAGSGSSLRA
jgi:hypothetical protein